MSPTPEQVAAFRWLVMNDPDAFLIGVRLVEWIGDTIEKFDEGE